MKSPRLFLSALVGALVVATTALAAGSLTTLGVGGNGASSGNTANNFRIRTLIGDTSFMGGTEIHFLTNQGDSTQPGAGTGVCSTLVAGTCPDFFDNNTGTEAAMNWSGNSIEFDFTNPQTIGGFSYRSRISNGSQAPRHFILEKFVGGSWVSMGEYPGEPSWGNAETRTYPVPPVGDEVGGHRYWRILPSAIFGADALWAFISLDFRQGTTSISRQFDAGTEGAGITNSFELFLDQTSGDNIAVSSSIATYVGRDFGRKRTIDHISLVARASGFARQLPRVYTVDWSDNNSTWTTLCTISDAGGTPANNERRTFSCP